MTAHDLKQRLQLLPVELQDKIQDFTFYSHSEITHIIPAYKPPIGLQINREVRSKTAQSFYPSTSFQLLSLCTAIDHIPLLRKWLHSLRNSHCPLLRCIRIYRPKWTPDNGFGRSNSLALAELLDLRKELDDAAVAMQVLSINSRAGDGETEEWWSFDELWEGQKKVSGAAEEERTLRPVNNITNLLRAPFARP